MISTTIHACIQFMLDLGHEQPVLFATLVIVVMAGEGLLLGLITDWLFRMIRIRGRDSHRQSTHH